MKPDPYQADEAAAFILTPQPGQPPIGTGQPDLFGIPADQVAQLAARCAPRARQSSPAAPSLFDDTTSEAP